MRETRQLDAWLLRISHISQLGLFLFTVGAIYFTVIPLYQKALLDEALAKKEVELKDANIALERIYTRVRTAVVKEYVFFAGAKCTGLLDRVEPQLPDLGKPVPARPPLADSLFALDIPTCLTSTAKELGFLHELRPEDRSLLEERLVALGEEILALRARAMLEHKEAFSRSASHLNALPPPAGFTGRTLEFLANRVPPERLQKLVREAAINAEQSRIANGYTNEVRRKISTLKTIKWTKRH